MVQIIEKGNGEVTLVGTRTGNVETTRERVDSLVDRGLLVYTTPERDRFDITPLGTKYFQASMAKMARMN